jgi:hypothetical protein
MNNGGVMYARAYLVWLADDDMWFELTGKDYPTLEDLLHDGHEPGGLCAELGPGGRIEPLWDYPRCRKCGDLAERVVFTTEWQGRTTSRAAIESGSYLYCLPHAAEMWPQVRAEYRYIALLKRWDIPTFSVPEGGFTDTHQAELVRRQEQQAGMKDVERDVRDRIRDDVWRAAPVAQFPVNPYLVVGLIRGVGQLADTDLDGDVVSALMDLRRAVPSVVLAGILAATLAHAGEPSEPGFLLGASRLGLLEPAWCEAGPAP